MTKLDPAHLVRISVSQSRSCAIGFRRCWDIHHTLVLAIFLETRLWVRAFGDPLHHGGHQSSFPRFTFHTFRAAQVFNTDQSQPLSCSFITRPQLFFFLGSSLSAKSVGQSVVDEVC